jgi:hypothetical protein
MQIARRPGKLASTQLRKVAATRAAEAGASEFELDALFGWRGQMAARYTRTINGDLLALQAAVRLKIEHLFPDLAKGAGRGVENSGNVGA